MSAIPLTKEEFVRFRNGIIEAYGTNERFHFSCPSFHAGPWNVLAYTSKSEDEFAVFVANLGQVSIVTEAEKADAPIVKPEHAENLDSERRCLFNQIEGDKLLRGSENTGFLTELVYLVRKMHPEGLGFNSSTDANGWEYTEDWLKQLGSCRSLPQFACIALRDSRNWPEHDPVHSDYISRIVGKAYENYAQNLKHYQ